MVFLRVVTNNKLIITLKCENALLSSTTRCSNHISSQETDHTYPTDSLYLSLGTTLPWSFQHSPSYCLAVGVSKDTHLFV